MDAVQPLAMIEIDSVTPSPRGFTLRGQGEDRAGHRLDVHFELPPDTGKGNGLGGPVAQPDHHG